MPGGSDVAGRARFERAGLHRVAGVIGQHLDVGAEGLVLAGVPHVVAGIAIGRGDPVGADEGPIQAAEGLAVMLHALDDLTSGSGPAVR